MSSSKLDDKTVNMLSSKLSLRNNIRISSAKEIMLGNVDELRILNIYIFLLSVSEICDVLTNIKMLFSYWKNNN